DVVGARRVELCDRGVSHRRCYWRSAGCGGRGWRTNRTGVSRLNVGFDDAPVRPRAAYPRENDAPGGRQPPGEPGGQQAVAVLGGTSPPTVRASRGHLPRAGGGQRSLSQLPAHPSPNGGGSAGLSGGGGGCRDRADAPSTASRSPSSASAGEVCHILTFF